MQLARVRLGRPGRIHVRDYRGQPQRRIKQRERREGRQVDPTRLHPEGGTQQLDLAHEMTVAVDHALGHAGGAAGEQDRGDVLAIGRGQRRRHRSALGFQPGQGGATPAPAAANGHQQACGAAPAQRQARHVGQADADEGLRLGLVQALFQRALVDARVDQHRHRAVLEQRKHQQEELRRGPHHHHGAHAAADAVRGQTGRHRVAAGVEGAVIQGDVVARHAAGPGRAGAADGDLVGAFTGQLGQARGDIECAVHPFIVAAAENSCAPAVGVENSRPSLLLRCRPRPVPHAPSLPHLRRLLHPIPCGLPLDGIGRGHPGGRPARAHPGAGPAPAVHARHPVQAGLLRGAGRGDRGVFALQHPPQPPQRVP